MKEILLKLSQGQIIFPCEWQGIPNQCEILTLNLVTNQAFVRFQQPVKKMVRQEVPTNGWVDHSIMQEVEVESSEEWINIK